jgi:hypothetical protein
MMPPLVPAGILLLAAASAFAADAPSATDPDIAGIVRNVSPARLETYVRALAGFGTRHSLSSSDDPQRGVGAARRWIKSTLDRCAAESGARLKVEFDEFTQDATPRIPKAVQLVNVVASRGRRPASQDAHAGGVRTLRLDVQQRDECHVRCAGRQRRRLRHGGRDRIGLHVREEPVPRHAGVHGGCRRGAGPAGRSALG